MDTNDLEVPSDVTEAASLATQLFEQLNGTEPLPDAPTDEPPAVPEPEQPPVDEDDPKTLRAEMLLYKSRLESLSAQYRELKQTRTQPAAPAPEPPPVDTRLEEVLDKLKQEYPDELIENLRLLNRLEAEQITREAMQPIVASNTTAEEIKYQNKVDGFVSSITTAAPIWENIWAVASELAEGIEPSDPRIAAFLESPDPSGLYTNGQLLDMYNENFDSERFAKVCNLYTQPAPPKPNPSRDALLAPSRVNNQPVPTGTEAKLWTMPEIEQFQRDKRAERYSPEQADAIWIDIQKALSENRIR